MRAKYILLLLGLSGAAHAAVNSESDAVPDAALLEFLADWQAEDQDWLDDQLLQDQVNEQGGEASVPAPAAQEMSHE